MNRNLGKLAGAALLVALALPARGAPPLARTISIDGDLSDWSEVLANPANVSHDGDGSTLACAQSTDRDCPVPGGPAFDLSRFAWTWDATNLYLYAEVLGGIDTSRFVAVYLDVNGNGVLGTNDRIFEIRLRSATADCPTELFGYSPANPGGDPLTDGAGFADGFDMWDRAAGMGGAGVGAAIAPSVSSSRVEASVPWSDLGGRIGDALFFHVALNDAHMSGVNVLDNMGGEGGAIGTTRWRGVEIGPGLVTSAAPGTTLLLPHLVQNTGNLPGVLALRATSALGYDITWRLDADGDGIYETFLATDAGGDSVLTLAGDMIAPAGDSDADGTLDVGLLADRSATRIQLEEAVPLGTDGFVEQVSIEAWHVSDVTVRSAIIDLARFGDVTLTRDESRSGVAGEPAWISHIVTNNLSLPATVNFSALSVEGWPWSFLADPNQDGDPSDASALTDSDGDGKPDVVLNTGERLRIFASAAIPAAAPLGRQECVFIRAHRDGPPMSTVVDSVVVMPAISVSPNHLLIDGAEHHGGAGLPVYFAHRLTNSSGFLTSFDLVAASDLGWPVTLLSDADEDGRPYDSVELPPGPVTLPVSGGMLPFIVRVDVPVGLAIDDTSHIDVKATATADPSVVGAAGDDVVVALVHVYEDAAHAVSLSLANPCSTVQAYCTGLIPSLATYRLAWRDPAGLVARLTPVTSDAAGTCADALALGPRDTLPGWSIEIQQWDGMTWTVQDIARFDVGDPLAALALVPGLATMDSSATTLDARLTVRNDSYDRPLVGAGIRFVVITPDGMQALQPDGTFAPITGSDATGTALVDLAPREKRDIPLSVTGVSWPMPGSYTIEAHHADACGMDGLLAQVAFEIVDDVDGDGLLRADELARGTDPNDADSDDDGLPDGAEALGDADGDTIIDALECDADGDGLPDGLESGIVVAGPGTDIGAGCFIADADPSTTTDPGLADTDAGGMSDGVEDANRNGAIDASETDPNLAVDDVPPCSSTMPPEVETLRVTKQGAEVLLTWTPVVENCTTHALLASDVLPVFADMSIGIVGGSWSDGTPLSISGLRCYLVRADSSFAGSGPTGLR